MVFCKAIIYNLTYSGLSYIDNGVNQADIDSRPRSGMEIVGVIISAAAVDVCV